MLGPPAAAGDWPNFRGPHGNGISNEKLTLLPGEIEDKDIKALHRAGLDDGQILEINQVAAYFAYANRTVTGLGVHTEGEKLGLAPEGEDWHHG